MKKVICLSLVALVSTSSIAADWNFITRNVNTGTNFYIDRNSISRQSNGNYKFWDMMTYTNSSKYKKIVTLNEISCADKMIRYLTIIGYYLNDTNQSTSDVSKWDYIAPDTTGEDEYNFICGSSNN